MNQELERILEGGAGNHLLPFFWQHGEDEKTLREYVRVIHDAGCGAFCVESRPHPDFCGPRWWRDMDVILEEAKKRSMQVWILDDSHFPTGFANGAVKKAPLFLHRQSVCAVKKELPKEAGKITLDLTGLIPPEYPPASLLEQYVAPSLLKDAAHFDDDCVIAATLVKEKTGEEICIPLPKPGEPLCFEKPLGAWNLWITGLSRNCGPHRDYINMLDPDSCRILIDSVYEPHWEHYQKYFGNTIAGFFSDEPELGNGHLYFMENLLGTDQDLPFSAPLSGMLEEKLGPGWKNALYLLWDNEAEETKRARVRFLYMDCVTSLVRTSFSLQLGDWCRAHGVRYIGHLIEDDNAHARTGSSLGHYFRGLYGQDMAGIDDIGGQVLPQGEDGPAVGNLGQKRDGTFYHFALGNLAASAAAIQPEKHGNAMCEIFGNYGWSEGVRLEKYLADHMLVRGVNYFVPHAFSPKPFPDPDCPPHFYAHGHNPQYRHFGEICRYMNRAADLVSNGHRIAPVAVLYHGEAEWAGKAMLGEEVNRVLSEAQIEYDTIPADVFSERSAYRTVVGKDFSVNTQKFRALVIPYAQFLPQAVLTAVKELLSADFPVFFVGGLPEAVTETGEAAEGFLTGAVCTEKKDLVFRLLPLGVQEIRLVPEAKRMRALHYLGETELYFLVNEDAASYEGTIEVSEEGPFFWYDPWENAVCPVTEADGRILLHLGASESRMLVKGSLDPEQDAKWIRCPIHPEGTVLSNSGWTRSLCEGAEYPDFADPEEVTLPDHLQIEEPDFSGFARYETTITLPERAGKLYLVCTDAAEGVEVFANGKSAGIKILPPFVYDLTALVHPGENAIRIEAATTLERECWQYVKDDPRAKLRGLTVPVSPTGITGEVTLLWKED